MYLAHFKLDKPPFQSKPDPAFFYLSEAHARAKTYLDYTVWNRDCLAVITGKIGCGKTTLINHLVARLTKDILPIKIHQTQLNAEEFLQTLLAKLGIEAFDGNKAKLLALLNKAFLEQHTQGLRILLIVDEAQHLSPEVLEEIRLLTGIEVNGEEIFNCILVGHEELMDTLNAPGLEQLSQRVRLRFHIPGLSEAETLEYIDHRLTIAGQEKPSSIFPHSTIPLIYDYSGGIPRLINILCDAAMVAAYAEDHEKITNELIKTAIVELQWLPRREKTQKTPQHEQNQIDQSKLRPLNTHISPTLLICKDGSVIKECPLDKNSRMTLGRYPNNDIVLNHELVSRHHALIASKQGAFILDDLNSSNGTYVNDKNIIRCVLRDGDKVKIGPYDLEYKHRSSLRIANEDTKLVKVPVSNVLNSTDMR